MSVRKPDSEPELVAGNLYLVSDGVLVLCPRGGCGCRGGGSGRLMSPFDGREDEFLERLLEQFPDPETHSLVKRYVELGWMREQAKERMTQFKRSDKEIKIVFDATTVFIQKEEDQYVALGYQPIDFSGYDPEAMDVYKKQLLLRVAVPSESVPTI